MEEGLKLFYALGGLFIGSMLLTYFTRSKETVMGSVETPKKKKQHKKTKMRDLQPQMTENGVVVLTSRKAKYYLDDLMDDENVATNRQSATDNTGSGIK